MAGNNNNYEDIIDGIAQLINSRPGGGAVYYGSTMSRMNSNVGGYEYSGSVDKANSRVLEQNHKEIARLQDEIKTNVMNDAKKHNWNEKQIENELKTRMRDNKQLQEEYKTYEKNIKLAEETSVLYNGIVRVSF